MVGRRWVWWGGGGCGGEEVGEGNPVLRCSVVLKQDSQTVYWPRP